MTPHVFTAIDPGLRGCGVAQFDHGRLSWACYIRNPMTEGRGPTAHAKVAHEVWLFCPTAHLIIEFPRIYPHGPRDRRSDPNDLLDVAGVAGACAALYEHITWVFPQQWKGQVPKEVMNARVMKRLSPEELAAVKSVGALDHNTYDAIGIGLHHLGRLR